MVPLPTRLAEALDLTDRDWGRLDDLGLVTFDRKRLVSELAPDQLVLVRPSTIRPTQLSRFILDGRAYAAPLDGRAQTARMLVLTALQKLAASSVAAIRSALLNRRAMLQAKLEPAASATPQVQEPCRRGKEAEAVALPSEDEATSDEIAEAEEKPPGAAVVLQMRNEMDRIDDCLPGAERSARKRRSAHILRNADLGNVSHFDSSR